MEQQKIKFAKIGSNNWVEIAQPDEELSFDWETTYSEDSGRAQTGENYVKPLFTVEAYGYTNTQGLTVKEVSTILKFIAKGKKFKMWHFSPYYGEWRSDEFYVGQGNITIKTLKKGEERLQGLSFQLTGVKPI